MTMTSNALPATSVPSLKQHNDFLHGSRRHSQLATQIWAMQLHSDCFCNCGPLLSSPWVHVDKLIHLTHLVDRRSSQLLDWKWRDRWKSLVFSKHGWCEVGTERMAELRSFNLKWHPTQCCTPPVHLGHFFLHLGCMLINSSISPIWWTEDRVSSWTENGVTAGSHGY